MDIAILSPLAALPRTKKLAQLFRKWGGTPKNHRVRIFVTKDALQDTAEIWQDLDVSIEPSLPNIVRLPPMSENEPFRFVAQACTEKPWFFLSPHTVPLTPDWADKLEREYLASGKRYLGVAAYIPKRYRDPSGIDRVAPGDPYVLEAAIYPPDLTAKGVQHFLSRTTHHEVARRLESFPRTQLTDQIISAEWSPEFRLASAKNAVVATRLVDSAVVDELLGNFTPEPPAPKEEPVTATVDSAPPAISFPVKEPTIKVISRSPTPEEADKVEAEPVTTKKRGGPKITFSTP
jgi:hypothetical protein